MPKNPYSTGKRSPGGKVDPVDEDAVARRYTASNWNLAQCAARFGISRSRVRNILLSRGIEVRNTKKDLDPDVVLRAYDRWNDCTVVALLLGASRDRVLEILDAADVKHGRARPHPCPVQSRA